MTRDVIAAADWILQNKDKCGIRVANFAHSSQANSFMYDPLDKAVEFWLSGVVVVAAAGNYGVGVSRAACRSRRAAIVRDHRRCGRYDDLSRRTTTTRLRGRPRYTPTGSPSLHRGAGRYMVMARRFDLVTGRQASWPRPSSSPVRGSDRRRCSRPDPLGASTWAPDQVKGALMVAARPADGSARSAGVGVVDVARRSRLQRPEPDAALNKFVTTDVSGARPSTRRWATASANASGRAPPVGCFLGLRVLEPGELGERLVGLRLWASASWASDSQSAARGRGRVGRPLVGQRRGRGAVREGQYLSGAELAEFAADPASSIRRRKRDPADTTPRRPVTLVG